MTRRSFKEKYGWSRRELEHALDRMWKDTPGYVSHKPRESVQQILERASLAGGSKGEPR